MAIAERIIIEVDYGRDVRKMIAACSRCHANLNITSQNFPTDRTGVCELEVVLVHFNRVIKSEEVLNELDAMGLRPDELQELLAVGAGLTDKQKQFPIIALGLIWRNPRGDHCVPVLWNYGRELNLGRFDVSWLEDCRFLASPKEYTEAV